MKKDENGFIIGFIDYRELPFSRAIQDELFNTHKHREEGEIYYNEFDVIKLLQMLSNELNPPKKSIEERKIKFTQDVHYVFHSIPMDCLDRVIQEFIDYWTEHGENAKKMRFEKEKVFDIKKRLERWNRNQKPTTNGTTTSEALNKFITD